MTTPLALLVAEAKVPILAYAVAVVVGTGAAIAVLWPARARVARLTLAPALIVAWASFVLAVATVISLGYQTRFFQQHDLREAGTAQRTTAPLPEPAVAAARARLRPGDTWALTTPDGRCEADSWRYLWLAFRLYPNRPDCRAPQLEVSYGVATPVGAEVLSAGADWSVRRP
jgi:hypothetical protein